MVQSWIQKQRKKKISPCMCNCRAWKTRLARIPTNSSHQSDFVRGSSKKTQTFFFWWSPALFVLWTLFHSNKAQEQPRLAYCLIHFYSPPWHCLIHSSMDQNAVYQLFVSTYHPDPNVHKQAELNIRNVSTCFYSGNSVTHVYRFSRLRLTMASSRLSFKF